MKKQEYELVQRDGGWAYLVDGRYSPVYASRETAIKAAEDDTKPDSFDQELDDKLEDGLENTFPASDPVSVIRTSHTGGPDRSRKE